MLAAAFLTYMAAAVSALMTLLYYLMRAGLFERPQERPRRSRLGLFMPSWPCVWPSPWAPPSSPPPS